MHGAVLVAAPSAEVDVVQENECMRQEMEHLLHYYGADIVLQGHVHSCAFHALYPRLPNTHPNMLRRSRRAKSHFNCIGYS